MIRNRWTMGVALWLTAGIIQAQGDDLVVPDGVMVERGIEYSRPDGFSLALNMARPKSTDGKRPVVLCIHGGGFRAGNRDRHDPLCVELAGRGYVAVTASYRLAPEHRYPAAVHDVKAAVRWLRANADRYGIDESRIGALGDSAGGHLALYLGLTGDIPEFDDPRGGNIDQSSQVQCVVDVYGPTDFTKSYSKSVDAAEVLPLFLGGDLRTAWKAHVMASPLYWVTPRAAPTLVIHGTEDKYVHYEQAVWFVDRMLAADVSVELLTLQGAGHGFKGADADRAHEAILVFFDKQLKRTGE